MILEWVWASKRITKKSTSSFNKTNSSETGDKHTWLVYFSHEITAKDLQKLQRAQYCSVVTSLHVLVALFLYWNHYIGFQSSLEYNSKYVLLYFVVSMMVSHFI